MTAPGKISVESLASPFPFSTESPSRRWSFYARDGNFARPRDVAGPRSRPLLGLLAFFAAGLPQASGTEVRSPANQVFQFAHTTEKVPEEGRPPKKSTAYLWIPEHCERLRGLVILGNNVPEHMLAGHRAIREACRENNLGLIWAVPTFWNFGKRQKELEPASVALLQELLDGLSAKSGYAEVATVPWLPVGESGHLLMVCGLINQKPDRVIAGICVKNPHHPTNFTVPVLWTLGTAQEWGQKSRDIRTEWNSHMEDFLSWTNSRAEKEWPLSILIEPATGHFACTEEMAGYFSKYISAAVRSRLNDAGKLQPVKLEEGFLANLPLPGLTDLAVIPYSEATPEQRNRAWFFTAELARDAQHIASTNWQAETQLVGFAAEENCVVKPFAFNSVTEISVTTDTEFSVKGDALDAVPGGFLGAGEKLARTAGATEIEWICGPFAPTTNGRFRIALDRTWKTGAASYLIARKEGDERVQRSVQPAMVKLQENTEGQAQAISFDPIPDIAAGSHPPALAARSDAGLPVEFTVISGPAVIEERKLLLTPIPPRAKFPVEVTVAAWQWGRASEPKVRTAPMVRQTFRIFKP